MSGEIQSLIDALEERHIGDAVPIEPGELSNVLIPANWVAIGVDGEHLLDHPRRAKGEVKVRSAKGFIDAVKQRWPTGYVAPDDSVAAHIAAQLEQADLVLLERAPVALYADDATRTLVAILNDDLGAQAGWRDHRVMLDVRKTPEWEHWQSHQGLKSQEAFAEAIELGQLEIQDPSPAQMLRIAETFEATVGVTFKKGAQVRDGAQQYVYEETIDAKAAGGTIEIPEGFTIAVAPFIGGPRYTVKARLKTRLVSGKFTIGYILERPEEIERAAFKDVATDVAATLNLVAVEGVAPAAR